MHTLNMIMNYMACDGWLSIVAWSVIFHPFILSPHFPVLHFQSSDMKVQVSNKSMSRTLLCFYCTNVDYFNFQAQLICEYQLDFFVHEMRRNGEGEQEDSKDRNT